MRGNDRFGSVADVTTNTCDNLFISRSLAGMNISLSGDDILDEAR
jgi:hypothetical protein